MSGLMVTFQANPQQLAAALGPDGGRDVPVQKAGRKERKKGSEGTSEELRRNFGETSEKLRRNFGETLSSHQEQILLLFKENAHLTARELAEKIGISSRGVEQNIARLKESGILLRMGPAKGGYWKVLK